VLDSGLEIEISLDDSIEVSEVVTLYADNGWSSAEKPDELVAALRNSDSLVTARLHGELVGIANAISDGYLVVYYPHLLVRRENHGQGIGRKIMAAMQDRYKTLHQQMLIADAESAGFYEAVGFQRAGTTLPMWIYAGDDH